VPGAIDPAADDVVEIRMNRLVKLSTSGGLTALLVIATLLAPAAMAPARAGSETTANGVREIKDLPYETVDGQTLGIDVFIPPGTGPFPGLVVLHGGGFGSDTKEAVKNFAVLLAERGWVAVPVEYRLAPQFPFPAALEDTEHAVEFLRQHAGQFNLDPARIGAIGNSAGGTLAASLATMAGRGDSGASIAGAASWSGPMDFVRLVQEQPRAVIVISNYVFGHPGADLSDTEPLLRASPITHVSPDDPPMFVANSTSEPIPFDQAREMVERLHEAGVTAELFAAPPGKHGLAYTDQAIGPTLAFLDTYVRHFHCTGTCGAIAAPPEGENGGTPGVPIVVWIVLVVGVVVVLGLAIAFRPGRKDAGRH